MTTPAGPGGTEGETSEGIAIVNAVSAAGAPHLVYSSVGGAERSTGIPHFESKRRVEEHIEELGMSATLLRPMFFMDNFADFMAPTLEDGTLVLRLALPAGVPLQLVAVENIGAAAAETLLDPSRSPLARVDFDPGSDQGAD